MKSEADIRDDVYGYIRTTELASAVSGQIYTDRRPTNSMKEDIHVRVQAATFGQIQTAVVLVRIYVSNLHRGVDSIPDTKRERELAGLAAEVLERHSGGSWRFLLESQSVEEAADEDQHCIINHLYYQHSNV